MSRLDPSSLAGGGAARAAVLLLAVGIGLLSPARLTAAPVGGAPASEDDRPIAIFFVRHAEKGSDDPRDPELSEAGWRRAHALAELLAQVDVTHLFATEYKRTRQTLQLLSENSGRDVTVIPARDGAAQVRALRDLPEGAVAVVAGHSNTIPGLACDLGGPAPGLDCSDSGRKLEDQVYDRMFLTILPPGKTETIAPRTLTLRYGD